MIENDDVILCKPDRIPNKFNECIIDCIKQYQIKVKSEILDELNKGDVFMGINLKNKYTQDIVFDNTDHYGETITVINNFTRAINNLFNINMLLVDWHVWNNGECSLGIDISDNNYIDILKFKMEKDITIVPKKLYDEYVYPVEIKSYLININCSNKNELEEGINEFIKLSFKRCFENKFDDPYYLLTIWKYKM